MSNNHQFFKAFIAFINSDDYAAAVVAAIEDRSASVQVQLFSDGNYYVEQLGDCHFGSSHPDEPSLTVPIPVCDGAKAVLDYFNEVSGEFCRIYNEKRNE